MLLEKRSARVLAVGSVLVLSHTRKLSFRRPAGGQNRSKTSGRSLRSLWITGIAGSGK